MKELRNEPIRFKETASKKKKFVEKCASNGKTVSEVLRDFVDKYLKRK
tara:strand:+ start:9637 stop:9780 length:144 start_codon:yes stop_codon:yes gene_type:complete